MPEEKTKKPKIYRCAGRWCINKVDHPDKICDQCVKKKEQQHTFFKYGGARRFY